MTNRELLTKVYSDGEELLDVVSSINDTRVTTWEERLDSAIRKVYGENSAEHKKLTYLGTSCITSLSATDAEMLSSMKDDIRRELALLKAWIGTLEDTEQKPVSEKKYQIFVSSTKDDLVEERKAVYEAILDLGHIPAGMEWFPSSDLSQWEYITKQLDTTDYVVLISAGKYGSIVPGENISWTEKEFDYCQEQGIPVLSFLYYDLDKLQVEKYDTKHRTKLDAFRAKISEGKLRRTYTSTDDLKAQVSTSLHQIFKDKPRDGWVRASDATQTVENNKNDLLQAIIDAVNEIKDRDTGIYWQEITE